MPWVRSSLAFVNGWADTVAVQRFGFPSSKMSGNAARMTKAIGKLSLGNTRFVIQLYTTVTTKIMRDTQTTPKTKFHNSSDEKLPLIYNQQRT